MSNAELFAFPPPESLETPRVLRALIDAHRHLAELKGMARSIPNSRLLISTLSLQEAQGSSEIENIITTQDALYRYRIQPESADPVSKEVAWYAQGLDAGFEAVQVSDLMSDLERYMHEQSDADALVRMAVIHHRFETIHPFYDGNGRTGRIVNILFLVKEGLLDLPILYLSRYISQTKQRYYQELQSVRESGDWEPWLLYMIQGVSETARHTCTLVESIGRLLQSHKHYIREHYRFYSQDLINNIFHHPYTKVAFVQSDLDVSRATATRYLDALAEGGILEKHRLGRENYYVNRELVDLLFRMPPMDV